MMPQASGAPYRLTGVMGWPIAHSRSPLIHNHWLATHGLPGAYMPFAIRPEGLEQALRALAPLGLAGVNLTIPHKVLATGLVDRLDAPARAIGAANLIVVAADGSLEGRNTDAFGFLESLREGAPDFDIARGPAVVLGAGGAARAIVYALATSGVRDIRILNRTRDRTDALAADFKNASAHDWAGRAAALEGASLVVQTTSLGMQGEPDLDLSLDALPADAAVTDIVYTPRRTTLLRNASARGNTIVEGLGMLLHQARPSFAAWYGIMPNVTPALRALVETSVL
jgi:shikimate dehydrogenase